MPFALFPSPAFCHQTTSDRKLNRWGLGIRPNGTDVQCWKEGLMLFVHDNLVGDDISKLELQLFYYMRNLTVKFI